MRQLALSDRLAIQVATWFGVGRFPKSPGTAGSIPGIAVGWLIFQVAHSLSASPSANYAITFSLLAVTIALAHWSIDRMEAVLHVHDDQTIVIDEVAGQAIAVAFLTPSLAYYVAAFVAFRILDITKPSIIGKIDRDVPGAWGTLGDDLLAGAVAGLVVVTVQGMLVV